MNKLTREFISKDDRRFPVQVGRHVASSLAGFIAGAVVSTIAWLAGWIVLRIMFPDMF